MDGKGRPSGDGAMVFGSAGLLTMIDACLRRIDRSSKSRLAEARARPDGKASLRERLSQHLAHCNGAVNEMPLAYVF